jgi:hypothetical protein
MDHHGVRDLLDLQLGRLRWRRRMQRLLDAMLPALALSLGIATTAVMVVRLTLPDGDWLAMPLAAAGILAPLILLPRLWRQPGEPAALLAGHLDQLAAANGLAMALAAQGAPERDADWGARLRQPLEGLALPALSWRAGRGIPFACLCLAVALCLPQAPALPTLAPAVTNLFRQAEKQFQGLDEAGLLPEAQRDETRRDLERLKAHAEEAGMDQPTWEGLDRLRHDLERTGTLSAQRLAQALVAAEALATPSANGQAASGPEAVRLAQALAELAAQAPGLVPRLPPGADAQTLQDAFAQAAANGALTPEQAAAVKQLGLAQAGGKAQTLDPALARQLAERLKKELEKNRELLKKSGNCQGFDDELGRGRELGRGGVDRGPGHGRLTWDDKVRTPGAGTQALPPGMQLNPDGSVTVAEQVRDAEVDDEALRAAARAATRAFDPTAADAHRATVAPRHREAVGRYFASGTGK